MKKNFAIFGLMMFASPAIAATCADGYYLSGGSCLDCGNTYYCANDIRYSCASVNTYPNLSYTASVSNGVWNDTHAYLPEHCICGWVYSDDTRTTLLYESACVNGPTGNTYTYYDWCRPGYYAITPLNFNNWYNACTPCTNAKPANSHYSSYGTPSQMYATDGNNCPWECDGGYSQISGSCAQLCAAGITELHAGNLAIPLFASKQTSPSIYIGHNGTTCYASLASGAASGALNVSWGGNIFHTLM